MACISGQFLQRGSPQPVISTLIPPHLITSCHVHARCLHCLTHRALVDIYTVHEPRRPSLQLHPYTTPPAAPPRRRLFTPYNVSRFMLRNSSPDEHALADEVARCSAPQLANRSPPDAAFASAVDAAYPPGQDRASFAKNTYARLLQVRARWLGGYRNVAVARGFVLCASSLHICVHLDSSTTK